MRQNGPGVRGRDLHDCLVGFDFYQRLIGIYMISDRDEPADYLGLGETLTDVGQQKLASHSYLQCLVRCGDDSVHGRKVVGFTALQWEDGVPARHPLDRSK